MNRTCARCAETKDDDEFRLAMKRGKLKRRAQCRACESAYYRSEPYREIHRAKLSSYRGGELSNARETRHAIIYRNKYPRKQAAKSVVSAALIAGKLIRPAKCERCNVTPPKGRDGRSLIQGHHEDYSRALEVTWLGVGCHAQAHRARATADEKENRG